MLQYYTRKLSENRMKRTIFYLCMAIFVALIIQPNLNTQDPVDKRVPSNSQESAKTNENANIQQAKSKATICIDAGNGGDDLGYSIDGYIPEKDINLQISLQLGSILKQMGYNVVYTRTDDNVTAYANEDDSHKERLSIAKNLKADYLISIQLNSDEDPLNLGYSIFTQQNDTMIQLANQIDTNLEAINYSQFKGLDSDHYSNFAILNDPEMTTIMIELGYITNADDYAKLTDESFQSKIAKAIADAFLTEIN